jgi:3-deoxy-D-manno-octulosonic-acid transferase
MSDRARILTFGFSDAEQGHIDARLSEIGVPAPTRLLNRHGSVVIGDILREGTIGTEELACEERLVLFHNVSDGGVRSLMQVFKSLEIPKPIFAIVTETSITWTLAELMAHLIEEKRIHEGS